MMRSPIPKEVRELLSDDPYMVICALEDFDCQGRIEWHHDFTYGGKRQNEPWCIIPLCHFHHNKAGSKWAVAVINAEIRTRITHFKAESDFRLKYPRSTLLSVSP